VALQQKTASNSYSKHSQDIRKENLEAKQFTKFLWGDVFYDEKTRKFQRKSEQGLPRSFVHFILEPFYKVVALTLSNEKNELLPILKKLGVFLNKKDFSLDIKPLLKLVMSRYFGDISCLVDSIA